MTRASTLLFAATFTSAASAQDWTVGVPVDMLTYSQTFYGGCTPGTDYTFDHPASPVSGVQYIAVITDMTPPDGSLDVYPGLSAGELGDTLFFVTSGFRALVLAAGTTTATMEFRAVGTPTQAGEAHPCGASPFWISNLGICPDGLTPIINYNCTVQEGNTAITEALSEPAIQWPSSQNGQQLMITLPGNGTAMASIVDASGRTVISERIGSSARLDLAHLPLGVHVLNVVLANGNVMSDRFLLNRQ